MKHFSGNLWAIFAVAAFAVPGTASAAFTWEATTASFFEMYNSYDQINGLQQGTAPISSGNIETPGGLTSAFGPMNSSVGLNGSVLEPAHGGFGDITALGSSSAYANLVLGTIGVSANASSAQPLDAILGRANAQAMLQDFLLKLRL